MNRTIAFLILSLMCFKSYGHVNGNDGGGGHFCKSQVSLFVENINATMEAYPTLTEKYPEWSDLKKVMDPSSNPGFVIKISSHPIQTCPNTMNALACGHPSLNVVEIYCGLDGWNSLPLEEQYKQVIHELYWWSHKDDTNYFFSGKMIKDIFPLISANSAIRLKSKVYRASDISSMDTVFSKLTQCTHEGLETPTGKWVKSGGSFVCTPKESRYVAGSCSFRYGASYSVILNSQYSYNGKLSGKGEVNFGVHLLEVDCKKKAQNHFLEVSQWWFKNLDMVNSAQILSSKNKVCERPILVTSYDPISNIIMEYGFERQVSSCE